MQTRRYSPLDTLIAQADSLLRNSLGRAAQARRPYPAAGLDAPDLAAEARQHAAGLMRVNHAGEVAAQALYQGQALTARDSSVRDTMSAAAREEADHLAWCEERLRELDAQPSLLNPLWYAGSLAIGAVAGLAGDRWSLGFLAETEDQVVHHLERHLETLPDEDVRSRAVVSAMRDDEAHHRDTATDAGGATLPQPARDLMQLVSRIMTRTAYRL